MRRFDSRMDDGGSPTAATEQLMGDDKQLQCDNIAEAEEKQLLQMRGRPAGDVTDSSQRPKADTSSGSSSMDGKQVEMEEEMRLLPGLETPTGLSSSSAGSSVIHRSTDANASAGQQQQPEQQQATTVAMAGKKRKEPEPAGLTNNSSSCRAVRLMADTLSVPFVSSRQAFRLHAVGPCLLQGPVALSHRRQHQWRRQPAAHAGAAGGRSSRAEE
jgi:hypothetical protein